MAFYHSPQHAQKDKTPIHTYRLAAKIIPNQALIALRAMTLVAEVPLRYPLSGRGEVSK